LQEGASSESTASELLLTWTLEVQKKKEDIISSLYNQSKAELVPL